MKRHNGFTLVELVVVVLILGILAAIAAPKIINNSDKAGDSSVASTLAAIRDAVELYKAEHNGKLPTAAAGTIPSVTEFTAALDPYLRGTVFPYAKVGGLNSNDINIQAAGPTVSGTKGWSYNWLTGEIIINSSTALASDPTTTYKDL
jgi:general secretion pathway protein G